MSDAIEKSPQAAESPISEKLTSNTQTKEDTHLPQPRGTETEAQQKWYQYFSPSDTPAERRLILKLDGLIIVFLFLAHWAKVLDSSATSTAYVSGMKEDLELWGNELNYLNTVYMYSILIHSLAPRCHCKTNMQLGLVLSRCKFH
ncbi:uncharacterized protein LDX57_012490 [Aspergillus melleus]|uniref:uncharacterized protein n=1 Tax=Aspergillus melleus TaxID=138277 RepID=UPI001E8D7913|nr:uncharacterized protein LDX57_012490 [Aspergillus melleus]KAH8434859.1 hypothetical protein LDX57_012490 [Aspergillus melleus]